MAAKRLAAETGFSEGVVPASHASYACGSMTTTRPIIRECSVPQYSWQKR